MQDRSILRLYAEERSKSWLELFNAEDLSRLNKNNIKEKVSFNGLAPFSSDADIVIFGSIARNECTTGSDVDWTLLIDGQANATHLDLTGPIENAVIDLKLAEPGTTGMFGQTTFTHDLIHYIGGEDDTNHNLSRRLLLLLESEKISFEGIDETGSAYDRTVRGIIQQYVDNDSGYNAPEGKENVPRFLLNDFIRFWRTMCVDFAYKQREQKGKKWALRNIKLRMSRRLIFIKGLLMCYKIYGTEFDRNTIKEELCKFVRQKPLDFLVSVLLENNIQKDHIDQLLESYNGYLELLNDVEKRQYLEQVGMLDVYSDEIFGKARENSNKFRDTLHAIFITEPSKISEFTLKYGVF